VLVDDAPAPARPDGAREEAAGADERRAIESRLLSEPVSPAWAAAHEARVDAVLAAERLRAEGIDAPISHRVECRSTLCRIDVLMHDETMLERAQIHLLHGVADGLGSARLFVDPQADGTFALVVYAGPSPR
jgi:hypothetical protein